MDRGAWQATVHGVAKSRARLSNFTFTFTLCVYLSMYIPKHVYTIRQGKSQLVQPFCSIQVFNPLGRPIHIRESNLLYLVYLFKCSSRLETTSPRIMFNQMSGHPMTNQFSSVQFSHSVLSNSLQPHGLQHARPPCPSPTPRVYSNSFPLGQ